MWGAAQQARRTAIAALALFSPSLALAGPPYVTDDPEPTDAGHWEIYAYANGLEAAGATTGEAGLDMSYGAAKDLQLTLVVPAAYSSGDFDAIGAGMVEAAAKYRFLHQSDATPDVAFFPRLFLPTAGKGLEQPRLGLLLPIWAEKDWGAWSLFGGGGLQINPGAGERNFWTGGIVLTRQVSKPLQLGLELWGHTADTRSDGPFAGLNLGADYRMTPHWSVLASGGPGLVNAPREGRWDFYLALKADY